MPSDESLDLFYDQLDMSLDNPAVWFDEDGNNLKSLKLYSTRVGKRANKLLSTRVGKRANKILSTRVGKRTNKMYNTRVGKRANKMYSTRVGKRANKMYSTRVGKRANKIYSTRMGKRAIRMNSTRVGKWANRMYSTRVNRATKLFSTRVGKRTNKLYSTRVGKRREGLGELISTRNGGKLDKLPVERMAVIMYTLMMRDRNVNTLHNIFTTSPGRSALWLRLGLGGWPIPSRLHLHSPIITGQYSG